MTFVSIVEAKAVRQVLAGDSQVCEPRTIITPGKEAIMVTV